jgi:hypothetical protein
MLSLLGVSNSHVEGDRAKVIEDGKLIATLAVQGQEALISCKIAGPD